MSKLWFLLLIIILAGCSIPISNDSYLVKVKWLGNSGFLIESNTTRLYINPYSVPIGSLRGDGILISNSNSDVCDLTSINGLAKESSIIIAPPACAARLASNNVIIISVGDTYMINDAVVKVVDAYNLNGTIVKGEGAGFIVTLNNVTIYYAGITDLIPEMNDIKGIDVLIVPIAGNHLSMNSSSAINLASMIKPNITIPMYYGGSNGALIDEGRSFKANAEALGINVTLLSSGDLIIR